MAVGLVDGKHYTVHVQTVKDLRRSGDNDAAAALLQRLIVAVEAEAAHEPRGAFLAPWYYEQLAIIYRKVKRFDLEAAILRRYLLGNQALGNRPVAAIQERLAKAQSFEMMAARADR